MAEAQVLQQADAQERVTLANDAAGEIEGLIELILPQIDTGDGLPVRTVLKRIRKLASCQMSALFDENDPAAEILARMEED